LPAVQKGNPSEQGLKPVLIQKSRMNLLVQKGNPSKQGLKHVCREFNVVAWVSPKR